MAESKVERKISVILAPDVVGYGSKIEENEKQTPRPSSQQDNNKQRTII